MAAAWEAIQGVSIRGHFDLKVELDAIEEMKLNGFPPLPRGNSRAHWGPQSGQVGTRSFSFNIRRQGVESEIGERVQVEIQLLALMVEAWESTMGLNLRDYESRGVIDRRMLEWHSDQESLLSDLESFSWTDLGGREPRIIIDNEGGYRMWISENPTGFVVNAHRKPRPAYMVLHRATCTSIAQRDAIFTSGGYMKVCGLTVVELDNWAESHDGGLRECRNCKPSTEPLE